MHGFYCLNILRFLSISTLLLIGGASSVVVVTNFRDPDWRDLFFSSMNHILLTLSALVLIASELDIFQKWFARYLPLIGPQSALATLGCIQISIASYLLSDRHSLLALESPEYVDKLLLATGIISGFSGLFNILASLCFRKSKPGKMRTIRRHGTPVPDSEKGSSGGSINYQNSEEPNSVLAGFKNAFRGADQNSSRRIEISGPFNNSS